MLFTSFNFLVFFTVVTILYWSVTHSYRWMILVAASLIFYAVAVPSYLLVLIFTIALNYFFGWWIGRSPSPSKKQTLLVWGIVLNLALFAGFKYFNSFSGLIHHYFFSSAVPASSFSKLIIPLGISFFTFSNISYLVEVKRMKFPAELHPGYFAGYVTFFPKLIQGPIERPQHFLPQLHEHHYFDYGKTVNGMQLMLRGFAKKLIIADRLAVVVDAVYADPGRFSGASLILATVLYSFQIYMDFSGYIDIARGAARILGFDLSPNFHMPYLSRSIKEFWTRWHMTLSGWLRDYLFLPSAYYLSGRMKREKYAGIKTEKLVYSLAIMLTFLICGIWHGTGWNFLTWGGLFAIYLMVGHFTEKPKKRFYRMTGLMQRRWIYDSIQAIITFLLVCFNWVFFRSPDMGTATTIISGFSRNWNRLAVNADVGSIAKMLESKGLSFWDMGIVVVLIPLIMIAEVLTLKSDLRKKFQSSPLIIRWGIYYIIVLLIMYFAKNEPDTFIYSKF